MGNNRSSVRAPEIRIPPLPPPPRLPDFSSIQNKLTSQVTDLQNRTNDIINKQRNTERALAAANKKVGDLTNQVSLLQQQLDASIASDKQHTQQMFMWQSKYNDAVTQINALTAEIAQLKTQIQILTKTNASLTVSNDVSSKMANAAININEEMTNQYGKEGLTGMVNNMNQMLNQNTHAMYDAARAQNNTLDATYQEMKNKYTTDNQKIVYQLGQSDYLNHLYFYLLITYYVLFLLFAYLFYKINNGLSIYLKVFVFSLVIIYPWVISYIERIVYAIWRYSTAILHGNPIMQ